MLVDHALLDYYDAVVLEGLKLAASDEARGSIDRRRAAEMTKAMLSVIHDLDDHVDDGSTAPASQALTANDVLCISGSGPFDDAVSAMIVQVLKQPSCSVDSLRHAAVSREEIIRLDLTGVSIIVLPYLEPASSPAHLQYLIKRLRQKAPAARIIAGLWPEGDAALNDEDIQ